MRKFLPYIFIFIVILGIFVPAFTVNGQTPGMLCLDGKPATFDDFGNKLCDNPKDQNGNPTGVKKVDVQNKPVEGDNSCGLTNIPACILKGLANIAYLILTILAFILWLSGILLEFVLKFTIIDMKDNISGMTGINIVWRTIRDLVNISFIFILLYEGIRLIISQSDINKAKNVIVGIIITAILINFSVFFTKVIIDTSNIVTIGFYKSITNENGGSQTTLNAGPIKVPLGISGAYVNALKIQEFYNSDNLTNFDPNKGSGTDYKKLTIIGIMGSILFLILSFIFFAISMMLIIRFAVLVFVLILSPIGFLGFGLPGLKKYQSQWWDVLLGQSMFAPLFMILTWINLTLLSNGNFTGVSVGAGSTGLSYNDLFVTGNSTNIGLIFNFIVAIIFAVMSLTISKGFATQGATQIGEYTGKLTAFAGGALMGGAAGLGRNTMGRFGSKLANNENLKDVASQGGFKGWAAKQTLKASDRTARSTFDARNTSTVGWATGQLGINMGKGRKDNFRTVLDAKAKKEEEFAKKLKPGEEKMQEGRDAKQKADEQRKKEKEIRSQLDNKEFKEAEAKKWKDHLSSEEYRNSDIYKNAEKEIEENEKVIKAEEEKETKLQRDLLELKEQEKNPFYRRAGIADEIKAKELEIENGKKEKERIKKELGEKNIYVKAREKYEKEWKSQEMKNLESEEKGYQEEAAKYEKTQKEIEGLHGKRASDYADTIENPGFLGKTANAVNTLMLGNRTTKADRKVIAKKIKGVAKQKTAEEEFNEAAAKLAKERKEKEDKEKTSTEEPKEGGDIPKIKNPFKDFGKDDKGDRGSSSGRVVAG